MRKRSRGQPAGGPSVESFACVDDDGRLCLVRVTGAFGPEDLVIEAAAGGREHRFPPVEHDPDRDEDPWVDFLVPSRLLAEASFTLVSGTDRAELSAPERAESTSGASIEPALLAQLDLLADQERRLTDLRAELRRQRERAARAQEELEEAEGRFEIGLLAQRHEVQVARQEADEARAVVADWRDREAARAKELAEVRDVLDGERAALQATLESERAAREEALENARAAHKEALEEVRAAAQGEIESVRAAAETEIQSARDAAKTEIQSARDAAKSEVDSALAAAEGELKAVRESLAPAQQELAAARARAADADQAAEVARKELEESREQEMAAAREVARLVSTLEEEKAARASAESRLAEAEVAEPAAAEPEPAPAEEPPVEERVAKEPPPPVEERPRGRTPRPGPSSIPAVQGARLIALDMALNGTPREATAEYLAAQFELGDLDALLDDIYSRTDTPSS